MSPAETRRGFLRRIAPLERRADKERLRAALTGACLEAQGVSCRLCDDSCAARAIRFRPAQGGRNEVRLDRDACTGCADCVAVCPERALTLTPHVQESMT